MDALRAKVRELEAALRSKDLKFNFHQDRLKKRVDELSIRNNELQEQIKVLERDRIGSGPHMQAAKPKVS